MYFVNPSDDFQPYVDMTPEAVIVELSPAFAVSFTRAEWDVLLDEVAIGQARFRRNEGDDAATPSVPDSVPDDLLDSVCWSLASAERLLGVPRTELLEAAGLDETCAAAKNPTTPYFDRGSLESWRELIG